MATNPRNPASSCFAVTPHDFNALTKVARSLYIGGAGNVSVVAKDDITPVVFKNVPAGSYLMVEAKIVRSTSTTATDIVALL